MHGYLGTHLQVAALSPPNLGIPQDKGLSRDAIVWINLGTHITGANVDELAVFHHAGLCGGSTLHATFSSTARPELRNAGRGRPGRQLMRLAPCRRNQRAEAMWKGVCSKFC